MFPALAVFLFDFATEVCAVFWVLSVNRRNKGRAVLYTCLSAALTRGALYLIIEEPSLLAVSWLGEVLGTFAAMVLDEKRKDVKRIQKRCRNWFTHSVLKRPVPKRVSKVRRPDNRTAASNTDTPPTA